MSVKKKLGRIGGFGLAKEYFEFVVKRDGRLAPFKLEKVSEVIFRAAKAVGGEDRNLANELAIKVYNSLKKEFGKKNPTVEQIQDFVEKELIESGHAKTAKAYILYRQKRSELRDSKAFLGKVEDIINGYLLKYDWRVNENSNASYSLSGLQAHISGAVIAEHTLNYIYPKGISDAHRNGDMHIHDLGIGTFAGYSFYRNETVVVRKRGSESFFIAALEQLFDLVKSPIVEENGFEIKYTNDFEVLDENGWTGLERVLRHKTDKKLVSLNSANGRNIIVTSDHPFITLKDNYSPAKCACGSSDVFINRSNKKGFNHFKCRSCNSTFKEKRNSPDTNERIVKAAGEIAFSNYLISPPAQLPSPAIESTISAQDAWFIGFFIAEGYAKEKSFIALEISENSPEAAKLFSYLAGIGAQYTVFTRHRIVANANTLCKEVECTAAGIASINIRQSSLPPEVQSLLAQVRKYSENKNLPITFANYADEIVGGMIAGVIDGDGTVRNDDKWVSRANIRVTSKTLLSQMQFWFSSKGIGSSLSTIDSYGNREYNGGVISSKKQLYSLTAYIPESKAQLFKESIKMAPGFLFSSKDSSSFRPFSRMKKIEEIKNDSEYVYDITTTSHTFNCNGVLAHNCAGWSLAQFLHEGFNGVPGRIAAKPAKHFNAALGQIVNFFGTLQNEWAGAQALSSFDTYLAPLVKKDNLSYDRVKQCMQEFIFAVNSTSRWGNQVPFTNLTFDWIVPEDMKKKNVIYGGKYAEETYGDFQHEMDMINRAFIEVMTEGDMNGRIFTFPIPTYNITRDFDWDSENANLLFDMTAKYGTPYFQNFVNSSLNPSDVRSMCLEEEENIIIRSNGKTMRMKIKEFVSGFSGNFEGNWAETKDTIYALSMNPETYKLEWSKIKSIYQTQDNILVRIKSKDGKEMKVSKDHPIAVYDTRGINTKRAEEMSPSDILVTTKRADLALSMDYENICGMKLDEDMAFFLGLFISEGNYVFETRKNNSFGKEKAMQFTFHEKETNLVSFVKRFAEERLGKEVKTRKDPRYPVVCCYINSTFISRNFAAAGVKKKGRLPSQLFNSPKSIIDSFTSGVFSGDGYMKGKELHINDKELASDIALLYTLIGKPVTYREKSSSQTIRLQHALGRGSVKGATKNDPLCERVPQFIVATGASKPFYNKLCMVSMSAIKKHDAYTDEIRKLETGDISTIKVESVSIEKTSEQIKFYDIELEENHYFVHSLGSITHNCCRLQLDLRDLRSKTGGLFGSGESTGSVGVVTINLPRLGYLSKSKEEFLERLGKLMYLGKESLEIKRKEVTKNMDNGLLPYTKRYLGNLNNHFSTIGLVGMNEACLNFMEKNIASAEGKAFAIEVLDFMREKLVEFQKETGHIYNLEATPAEGTSYRLARIDKKAYPGIISAGTEKPYYTNSTQLPVSYTDDIFEALEHQDELQAKYTGGTVLHGFIGEALSSGEVCKKLVKKIAYSFRLPYYTITPTFSVCPVHGYIKGKHETCPVETENDNQCSKGTETFSRVVGYYRPIQNWNEGKKEEFTDRKTYSESIALKKAEKVITTCE